MFRISSWLIYVFYVCYSNIACSPALAITLGLVGILIALYTKWSTLHLTPPPANKTHAQFVNESPRVYVLDNFITDEEADYMIEFGKPILKPSGVVGKDAGKAKNRQSEAGGFGRGYDEDPTLVSIVDRIFEFMMLPKSHGEPVCMYVLTQRISRRNQPLSTLNKHKNNLFFFSLLFFFKKSRYRSGDIMGILKGFMPFIETVIPIGNASLRFSSIFLTSRKAVKPFFH